MTSTPTPGDAGRPEPAPVPSGPVLSPRQVQLASAAVFATFVLNGFNFANWAARLPAVRDQLELRPNEMGVLLLLGAIGSLAALPLSGLVVQRLGARRTILTFAVINVVGLLVAATGVALGTTWLVAAALVLFGIGTGVWDAAMNLEGAAVEQALHKAVMPRFHAGFSLGTLAGAGVGALAAWLQAPVVVHLAVALTLSLTGVVISSRWFLPEGTHSETPGSADGAPRRSVFAAWLEPRTLLIGLVVLAAALTEGAANDWVSLAVVDGFGTSNAVGALGFAVFVTAMTGMRFLGTSLLDRWGRIAVLRLSAGLALVGLLVFGLSPWMWLALVGVLAWGAGAALGFPVGMSAASDDPLRAAPRVAVVATIGYSAFLAGPPLLGFLAEHVGYREALLVITIPVVIGLFVLRAAEPLPTAAGARPRD
ncbi:MFS transporter [Actinotalea sp. C106]|uniref:MFS transporter n=1 Tax=Actinotalea sp. C106 TaxID=2908644 RepID=UPI00202825C2|nr:MFS transporter [Actinotalea sp. C106]